MKGPAIFFAAGALALLSACEATYSPPPITPVVPAPDETGTIAGDVLYQGAVPKPELEGMSGSAECMALQTGRPWRKSLLVKDGKLQNAFVYVKSGLDPKWKWPLPAGEHVVANEHCVYVPRVSGARVWQKIRLENLDPTQHNIRSEHWSRTFLSKGQYSIVWVEKPQVMLELKCDLHGWMTGYLGLLEHPFFAVTDETGAFSLSGVPAGTYTVEVWHETLGTRTTEVKVRAGEPAKPSFTYP